MYGYFRCPDCNGHWESAHTYPKQKGNRDVKQFWAQKCKSCGTEVTPYRVKATRCSQCGEVARDCNCDKHSDPEKPHRSDLCMKCKAGHPCQFRR